MAGLLLPVGPRRMASWQQHQDRDEPSSEPGTDFYCPIGTPVYAPADGEIYGYGTSISPATGRWSGVNFANGMSFRGLHYVELRKTSGRVFQGDLIALSGATGYGEEDWSHDPSTGGSHLHATLWPTWEHRYGYRSDGRPYTVDFMDYVDGTLAGGGSTPFEEDDMFTDADRNLLTDVQNKLSYPGDVKYGRVEVIQQDTADIRDRIRGPQSQPYDQIQRIRSVVEALAEAQTPDGVDVAKLIDGIETRLEATFADALAEANNAQLVALRAELVKVNGVTESDLDAALATLTISRSS